MDKRTLIIGGALLFSLGVATGMLLAPGQSEAPPSQAASVTGSKAAGGSGDSTSSGSASADSDLAGDFGSRLQGALSGSSQRQGDHALPTVPDGLTPAQIQAALQKVQKLNGKNKFALLSQLLGQWAVTDAKGATQYAMAFTSKTDRDKALSAIAAGWAESDPKAAEAWAASLQDPGARDAAIGGLIDSIASADPQHALTLAQSLPPGQAASCEYAIFTAWADTDPQGAAAEIAKIPDGSLQQASIKALATAWSGQDSASAIAWALSLGTADQQFAASTSIAAVVAPDDPEAMANFGLQLAGGHGRVMVLNAALRSWMSEDPSGALDWLQQLPDADGTRSEVASTAENLSLQSASPAVAAQIASLMQPGQQQNAALQQVLTSWLQADPNAAMAWARQQTDTQVQASIFPVIASQMAATNVQGAISFAQALTGDARVNSMNSVVVTWAGNDPAAAAAYVAQEPDGQEKTQEIGSVASAWEQNAPAVANEWLGSLPTGATKDDALQGAAAGVSQSDPAAAETLVAGIGDDQTRVVAETQIAREWINSNPGAATAWIQSSTLPPQIKDSLLIAVRVGQNN